MAEAPVHMMGWFTFCGFEQGADNLVFEATVECEVESLRAALDPDEIADDPATLYVYPITRGAVATMTGRGHIPEADYFVNASQPPGTFHAR